MKLIFKYCLFFSAACLMAGIAAYLSILAVTKSPEKVVIPNLVEKDLAYVLESLTGLGLNTKLQGIEYSEKIPRNHVLTQFPEPGTLIKKGRDVMIRISKGKKEIPMPDLRRLSLHKAELMLENSGLILKSTSRTSSDTTALNAVITQYPLPGGIVSRGIMADILVSSGPERTAYVTPDLTGLSVSDAETLLSRNNLVIGTIGAGQVNTLPENTIMLQTPVQGTRILQGTPVNLTVNRDPTTRTLTVEDIQGVREITFHLDPGFLNRHIRIEADLFGTTLDLLDDYVSPAQATSVLIPNGITTEIRVFVDDQLTRTQRFTPWQE